MAWHHLINCNTYVLLQPQKPQQHPLLLWGSYHDLFLQHNTNQTCTSIHAPQATDELAIRSFHNGSTRSGEKTITSLSSIHLLMWSTGRKSHLQVNFNQHVNSCPLRITHPDNDSQVPTATRRCLRMEWDRHVGKSNHHTWTLQKWKKVIVCTHVKEHKPSSRGLLLCTSAIVANFTSLHPSHMVRYSSLFVLKWKSFSLLFLPFAWVWKKY